MDRTCAIVQGNLRTERIHDIVQTLQKDFDSVVVSCWEDDRLMGQKLRCPVIYNRRPAHPGLSNRNLQRLSVDAGLTWACEQGATHVLKWRTDMLPTKLNIATLLSYVREQPDSLLGGRIVVPAFRNLTVTADWFSSVPDLFAFGPIEAMSSLWGVSPSFDFSLPFNVPPTMRDDLGDSWQKGKSLEDVAGYYCAETEVYAWFRDSVERTFGINLDHQRIVRDFFRLINHADLQICWFGTDGFRPIGQAWEHPWWTVAQWRHGSPYAVKPGYEKTYWWQTVRAKLNPGRLRSEIRKQATWYKNYQKKMGITDPIGK